MSERILGAVPGLALVAVGAVCAWLLSEVFDSVSQLVVAMALGIALANLLSIDRRMAPGTRVASRPILKAGVVLLGFQLSWSQLADIGAPTLLLVCAIVAVTFVGTQCAARWLGLSEGLGLLVASGFSICGASAIAAVEGVTDANEEDVAYSITLVTLCGSVAVFVLPLIGRSLGLGSSQYGTWVGASVHDVGQVVAAATSGGHRAVAIAVVVKLVRVLLLGPLLAVIAYRGIPGDLPSKGRLARLKPPLFVMGFLAATAVRSSGQIPEGMLGAIQNVQVACLTMALFALGLGVDLRRLRQVGLRPVLLGGISWAMIAIFSLAGIQLFI